MVTPNKVSLENLTLRYHTNSVIALQHLPLSIPAKQAGVTVNTRNELRECSFGRLHGTNIIIVAAFRVLHRNKLRKMRGAQRQFKMQPCVVIRIYWLFHFFTFYNDGNEVYPGSQSSYH